MVKKVKTGGRKPGAANLKTRRIADMAIALGITPLEYMLKVMHDENAELPRRDEMAKSAAPYIHPKLAAVEHKGDGGGPVRIVINGADAKLL